jgi:hypothetical protein
MQPMSEILLKRAFISLVCLEQPKNNKPGGKKGEKKKEYKIVELTHKIK